MRRLRQKLLAGVVSAAMLFTMMPAASLSVYAEDDVSSAAVVQQADESSTSGEETAAEAAEEAAAEAEQTGEASEEKPEADAAVTGETADEADTAEETAEETAGEAQAEDTADEEQAEEAEASEEEEAAEAEETEAADPAQEEIETLDEGEGNEAADPVAQIGETGYATVAAALEAAGEGDTITLLKDVQENVKITKAVTLDLGGFTLTGDGTDSVINIDKTKGVTVENGTVTGGAGTTMSVPSGNSASGGGIAAVDSEIVLKNLAVTGNKAVNSSVSDGGGVFVSGGRLTMDGVKVTGNTASDNGGGVAIVGTDATITDCEISGNSSGNGGGLAVNSHNQTKYKPTVAVKDTVITGNIAGHIGGGVYLAGSSLTLTGCAVDENTSVNDEKQGKGGGICLYDDASLTLERTSVKGNSADFGGGLYLFGVAINGAEVTMDGETVVSGNTATYNGAGMNVYGKVNVTLNGTEVSNNSTAYAGAGIFAKASDNTSAEVTLNGAKVTGNGTGGGIYAGANVTLTANGAEVSNNTSTGNGAGIYAANKSTVIVTGGSKISSNTAGGSGGGIYADNNSTISAVGAAISGNTAEQHGGIYADNDSTISAVGAAISGNTAKQYGGGIRIAGENVNSTLENLTITKNKAEFGSAISVASGEVTLKNCDISSNTASESGAVRLDNSGSKNAKLVLEDDKLTNNTAAYGGAVSAGASWYLYKGTTATIELQNTDVTGNTATGGQGGAVYLVGNGTRFTMTNGVLIGNSATSSGGAVYSANYGGITLSGVTVTGNKAAFGGAISMYNTAGGGKTADYNKTADAVLNIVGGTLITNNTATSTCGGGVYVQASETEDHGVTVNVEKGSGVYANTAKTYGDDIVSCGGFGSYAQNVLNLCAAEDMGGDRLLGKNLITGWYYDGYKDNGKTERWSESYVDEFVPATDDDGMYTALKAAYPFYGVTYDANGGTGTAPETELYAAGEIVTVKDNAWFTRDKYVFTGWNTAADGSGTAYEAADLTGAATMANALESFTMPAANVTLYAQWTPLYAVNYDANGGTGTAPDEALYEAEDTVTVSGNGWFARSGYKFTGWNTAADGKGTAYTAGAEFAMPKANVTLYAQWEKNSSGSDSSHTYADYTVKKLWVDNGATRPASVDINLYRTGGEYVETVTLSEANGWSYTWKNLDESYQYAVSESSVPSGYVVSYKVEGNTFYVTNTYSSYVTTGTTVSPTSATPRTGDTSSLALWAAVMAGAMGMLSAVVIRRKRNH